MATLPKPSNTEAGDTFGLSVAISGQMVVVGASGEASNATGVNDNQSDNSVSSAGAAYVFVRSGTTWAQQAYLKASNTGASAQFGFPVSISGGTVAVGAQSEQSSATGVNGNQSDNSLSSAGAAYVFTVVERTALENWRLQHFGNSGEGGEGADLADVDSDGSTNLFEFATGESPVQPGGTTISCTQSVWFIEVAYTRNKVALAEAHFIVEWSDSLSAASWSAVGVSESILHDDGLMQQVVATVPLGTGNRRFVRLRASSSP